MNTELKEYFSSMYRKTELADFLDFFDLEIPRNMKKEEMVQLAAGYIGEHPSEWLSKLPERDLRLLDSLVCCGADTWTRYEVPEFPTLLEGLRLVFVDDKEYEDAMVILPKPVYSVTAPFIREVIEEKEASGAFDEERIGLGILNIYGAIPVDDFIQVVYDIVGDDHEKALDVVRNPLFAAQRSIYKDEMYLVSPYAFDCEHIIENRKPFNRKIRKYVSCSMEDAISAGKGAPFCAFGVDTDGAAAVLKMLGELGFSDHDALRELHEIWFNAQFTMEEVCTEAMFRCINDRIDDIPSFSDYRRYIDTIAAYANSMPKWLLKGRSSNDADLLKLAIKVDESIFDANAGDDYLESGEETPQGPLEEFYRFGIGVRHVHPNAPCPCGSGLSYRNCHGRKLS